MIQVSYFENITERFKKKFTKDLEKDHGARIVEQGCLVQDITGTNAQVVTIVYLVRPINADLGEVKLAGNVFQAWIRTILNLLKQLKGE